METLPLCLSPSSLGGSVHANHNLSEHRLPPLKPPSPPTHVDHQSEQGEHPGGVCDRLSPPQLALSVSTLIAIGPEERLRSRPFMRGSTCHLTWITFTTSPECLPLAG